MPRRSSRGRSSRSSFRPAAHAPLRNPPQPVAPAPPLAPIQSGSASRGIGSVVAEGMAFGGGSAMAHRAVDAVMGPTVIKYDTAASPAPIAEPATMNSLGGFDACGGQSKAFQDCLNNSGSDISKCQFYMDILSECRKNTSSGLTA
ncbi:unnamed protein product [Ilex paraguariensis]|uniref:CHCH domain-containing protein n=1 Tax=Ilex paraguariensis TaxID=185542 RepID=A0ABC8T2N2_9AQUA